ncbi:LLM class flavin-dependent oxidoreductase [Actinomyces trachealis]|uniref:LLM class flavin-dependent oxidoreductase n=1 Tax=Actinomyces trachealis TaxID=2763540 RepID=UPI001892C2E3
MRQTAESHQAATPAHGRSRKGPVLSVLDMVPVSAGRSRAQALDEMVELARTAEDVGYERYWIAEHHGSTTFLAAATTVLMGHVLDATQRIQVVSGGIMLPNHPPLVVAEQIGTLATIHPGRVGLGLGRAPGTDRLTAKALCRRAADPISFSDEVLDTLSYLDDAAPGAVHVPGSLSTQLGVFSRSGREGLVSAQQPALSRPVVRALPGEGTQPPVWILGSSVHGARVAGRLGLPFVAAAHFAPQHAEAAIMAYRSVFDAKAPSAQGAEPRSAAAVQVAVASTRAEARRLFTTAQAVAARLVAGKPAPLEPSTADLDAWKSLAPGKETMVEASLARALVGEPAEVADGLRALAQSWELEELVLLSNIHDAQARRDSYTLLAEQW